MLSAVLLDLPARLSQCKGEIVREHQLRDKGSDIQQRERAPNATVRACAYASLLASASDR